MVSPPAVEAKAVARSEGAKPAGQPTSFYGIPSWEWVVHFGGVHRRRRWFWPLLCPAAFLEFAGSGMSFYALFLVRTILFQARLLCPLCDMYLVPSTLSLYLFFT